MKNKISLLAFVNQPLPRRAIAEYESVFAAAYGECRFEQFTDSRELFSALAGAFGDSETVVLAASERHYIEIKKLLFDALRTKTASSDRIAEVLEKADEDQCLMPADAQILVTDDGKYSGFIEKSGSQTLVFLPLSDGRCAKVAEELKLVFLPVEKAAESANTTEPDANGAGEPSAEEKCDPEEVVALLKERGLSVAVASSKNSPFVFSVLPYDDESDFGDAIFARSVDIKRQEDESHGEYIAAMAGRARAKSGASIGAAISNVFRNDDEDSKHFMLICIADENKARVFKVFSRKGETTQEFIYACVRRLYSALADYARNGFVMHDVSDDASIIITDGEHHSHHKSAPVRSGKKTALIVAAIILLAALIGTAITFLVKGYGSQVSAVLINARESDTSESNTVENSASGGNTSWGNTSESDTDGIIDDIDDMIIADVERPNGDTADSGKTTGEQTNGTVPGSIAEGSTVLTTVISTKPTTRPNTTGKPTTKPTQKPTETTTRHSSSKTGTFVFTVYGYGHGVGMSQNGANNYATYGGYDYQSILFHYFPGTTLVQEGAGSTVTANGVTGSYVDIISQIVYNEMSSTMHPEAMKAQAIAAYTYIMFNGGSVNNVILKPNPPQNVIDAVSAVAGQALYYDGSYALTVYGASSGGATASAADIWGRQYDYLVSVPSEYDAEYDPYYGVVTYMSVDEVRSRIQNAYGVSLSANPSNWIRLEVGDSGYVRSVNIDGQKTVNGDAFRSTLGLRSARFAYVCG